MAPICAGMAYFSTVRFWMVTFAAEPLKALRAELSSTV